jgi:hypothetical protein
MEPVTALSVGIQPYPNRIRKITRYGLVTGLAPTELVPRMKWNKKPHQIDLSDTLKLLP